MSTHDPNGQLVCIHSVCVEEKFRRKGIALSLLSKYVEHVKQLNKVKAIALISHEYLLPLYTKAGFVVVGPSPVQHGSELWIECRIHL